MRHHPEDVGVAVLGENFTGAIIGRGGVTIFDAGHSVGFPMVVYVREQRPFVEAIRFA